MRKGLSKSRLMLWRQCPKRLHIETYQKEKIVYGSQAQRLFRIGHELGEAAQRLFPDGVLIEHIYDLKKALFETEQILTARPDSTLCEATFQHEGVLIRADIFWPLEEGYCVTEVNHRLLCMDTTWMMLLFRHGL